MKTRSLQERVERMLAGERKRRDVALQWLAEVEPIIASVGEDVWGGSADGLGCPTYAVWLKDDQQDGLYFRYRTHKSEDRAEAVGFYCGPTWPVKLWGEPVETLRGSTFWWAIRTIVEWIPKVAQLMDEKEKSRQALLDKFVVD